MRQLCYFFLLLLAIGLGACSNDAPPQAAAVRHRDSLPLMTSYGISKLISDSGVVRYKIMTEEWRVFDRTHPPRNEFLKGVFLQRYDAKFNVDLYITADTAYWYDQKALGVAWTCASAQSPRWYDLHKSATLLGQRET